MLAGLVLALLASVRHPVVRWPLIAWVDFFRALPPLVLVILLLAKLPFAGLELGRFVCMAIAFFLNTGAYYSEILRAGIDSVVSGEIEAARSTGLSRLQAMTYVVLPQAVRNVLPDLFSASRRSSSGPQRGTPASLMSRANRLSNRRRARCSRDFTAIVEMCSIAAICAADHPSICS